MRPSQKHLRAETDVGYQGESLNYKDNIGGKSHLDYLMDEIKSNEAEQAERDTRLSLNRFLQTRQSDINTVLTTATALNKHSHKETITDDLATRVSYLLSQLKD